MKKKITQYLICFLIPFIACQSESTTSTQVDSVPSASPEINQLNQMLQSYPEEGDLWYQRGSLLYDLQKYPEAIRDLQKAVQLDTNDIEAWHLLADALLDNLQSREALQTMESVVEMFPKRIPSLLKLSEFQLILKRYAEAATTISQIQALEPDNADAHFMKAMVLKESGDTSAAIAQFQESTKENPQMIDAWINLGQLHEASGDSDAIRYFDGGLAVSPDNPLLLHAKAQYLARNDYLEEAKNVYRTMMKVSPYESEPYYDMGLLYLDQDSLDQAVAHFELSIKIDPMFSRAYFYRGLTLEMLGQVAAARQDYEQTLQINPEDQDASQAIKRLDKKI